MNTLVSVIIPTHNRSQLLVRAVNSVLSQTYSNLECIVVDDASTDDTQKVIQEFTDPRLIYIRHDVNKHASASRNTGIQNAKGEFIAFLDDDDAWLPKKLEKQVKCLSNTSPQVGLVYCWFDTYRDQEVVGTRRPNLRGYIFDQLLVSQPLGNASTLLVRREVINQIGGFDENLPRGNDGDFIRRVGQHYEIEVVPEVLVHYFVDHGNPRITSNDLKGIQDSIKGLETRLEKFSKELSVRPKVYSHLLNNLANRYFSINERKKAVFLLIKSFKLAPLKLKNYKDFAKYLKHILINLSKLKKIKYAINWRRPVWKRTITEYLQRYKNWNFDENRETPYVIYMTGMPRTGSSLMKNFLADYEGLKIMPFQPLGFFKSWEKSILDKDKVIYIDKSTHYIRHLDNIIATCQEKVMFCCIVRDPRDQLMSLFEFKRHPELERNNKFWKKWFKQYNDFLSFASYHTNNKFFLIRYEDIVRYPVEAKVQFLKWVGFNPEITNIKANYNVAHEDDIDDKVKSQNTTSKSSIGRHKLLQDPQKRNIIDAYIKSQSIVYLMKKFGYLPQLTEIPPKSFSNITLFVPNLNE